MSTSLYQIVPNYCIVYKRASYWGGIGGLLSKGTIIEVISISNGWAYLKYNGRNAYVSTSNLSEVAPTAPVTGSVTINYLDASTNAAIATASMVSDLKLSSYSYDAITIKGYSLVGNSSQSVTLTESVPDQVINFVYKKILGNVTIKYINQSLKTELLPSESYSNLELGIYSYNAKSISDFSLISNSSISVELTDSNPNQSITFEYKEILGSVIVKYLDKDTSAEVLASETFSNLKFGSYTYTAKTLDNYNVSGQASQTVTLNSTSPNQTVTFSYTKILGSITIKYVDATSLAEIAASKVVTGLALGSYSYSSIAVTSYTVTGSSTQSVTLTKAAPNATITFKYNKNLGSVTVKYLDNTSKLAIADAVSYSNLEYGTYSYDAKVIDGYKISGDSSISVTLTFNEPIKTIEFMYVKIIDYNSNEIPYISTYYYNPKPFNDEELIIPFYITDYYQKEYLEDDTSENFIVEYEVDGIKKSTNMKAGDRELNLGVFSNGEHWFSLQVINNGVKSHKLYNEFLVVDKNNYDIKDKESYSITQVDLDKYGIKTNNSTITIDMTNTREGLTLLFNEIKDKGYKKCILLNGVYRINWDRDQDDGFGNYCKPVTISSDFTVDLNGSTIKLDGNTGNGGYMILMKNCYDSHLINGTLDGNYDIFDITGQAGEHLYATQFEGCKYSSFEDLTIKNITGYACMTKVSSVLRTVIPSNLWVYGKCIDNGNEIGCDNKYTCDFIDITEMINDKYISINRFLGYQGFEGSSMYVDIHFYDKSRNFLSTVKAIQYRKIRIVDNAKYIRVTLDKIKNDSSIDLQATNFYTTTNCAFKNIKYINTRACALAPTAFNNLLIENCTFDNCGQNLTPLAIDFEDGWEMGQDCYFRNNTILIPAGTGDLITCRGQNYVIENCNNFRVDFRGGTIAPVYRNNLNSSSIVYYSSPFRIKSCYCRIYNNIFNKGGCQLSTDYDYTGELDAMPSSIKDCTFIGACPSTNNKTSKCVNCDIDLTSVKDFAISTYISNGLTLYNSNIYGLNAKNAIIASLVAYNSKIENMMVGYFAIKYLKIYNSTLNNSNLSTHSFNTTIIIDNSNINNFYIESPSWAKSKIDITIINSTINNFDKFARLENLNSGSLTVSNSTINILNDILAYFYCSKDSLYTVNVSNNNISSINYVFSGSFGSLTDGLITINSDNNIFNNCTLINNPNNNKVIISES